MPTVSQNSILNKFAAPESAAIRFLRESLRTKNSAETDFWQKIERETLPIYEKNEGDSELVVCTFVFKGDERTESVFINIPPFSRVAPADFQMSRIPETNVWSKSVKLPAKSRFAYNFIVNYPRQTVNPESSKAEIAAFRAAAQLDFLNPNRLNDYHSFLETPGAEPQKYLKKRSETERGKIEQFVFKSRLLENERTISVYTPPDYDSFKSYPLLILFDENIYLQEIDAPTILDNLRAGKLIPPLIAVFVGNAPNVRESELPCNPRFSEFVTTELLNRIKNSYKISEKPTGTIIGGASFGGLCAVYTALSAPATFGKILSQSGSFWRNYNDVIEKIEKRISAKQKFYLDAGIYETEMRNGSSLLEANRNLQNVLRDKGHAVSYQEFSGGHGAANWSETFADGLIFLMNESVENENLHDYPN